MEARGFTTDDTAGTDAPSTVVQLHGVPVPSRVLGFSVGWHRPESGEKAAESIGKVLRLLRSDADAIPTGDSPKTQEVAAA